MKVSELLRQAAHWDTNTLTRPGPHWNPWPQKQETVPEALKEMQELAQHIMKTKIYPADVGTKLQQIQVSINKAIKGNEQGWKVAKEVYEKLPNKHLVPQVLVSLIHDHQ
jgi:hypothetical protein